AKSGTISNFPMQANGAEMLRLACCFAVDRNISIIAPIHDALLIEGPITDIEDVAREMRQCMVDASRAVMRGPTVRVDMSKPLTFPDRYVDGRDGSVELSDTTLRLLAQLKRKSAGARRIPSPTWRPCAAKTTCTDRSSRRKRPNANRRQPNRAASRCASLCECHGGGSNGCERRSGSVA